MYLSVLCCKLYLENWWLKQHLWCAKIEADITGSPKTRMSKLTPGNNPDLVHLLLTGLKTSEISHVSPLGGCRNLLCSRRGRLCRMIVSCSLYVDGKNTYRGLEKRRWCNTELRCTACWWCWPGLHSSAELVSSFRVKEVCFCCHSCFSRHVLFAATFDTAVINIAARHVIFLWQILENSSLTSQLNQHCISQGLDPESWIADSLLSSLECSLD